MSDSSEERKEAEAAFDGLKIACGPHGFFGFGELIATFRACEQKNEAEFARVLGVSESYLRDVEARREVVSPSQAAAWARAVGYYEAEFVRRVLQDLVDEAKLGMRVSVEVV